MQVNEEATDVPRASVQDQSGRSRGKIDRTVRSLSLYAHTLARMQPRQVLGVGERKARHLLVPRLPVDFDARYDRAVPEELSTTADPIRENNAVLRDCFTAEQRGRFQSHARSAAAGSPTFLNRRRQIGDGRTVDWHADVLEDLPIDWRLKLYGFEPLVAALRGVDPDSAEADKLQQQFDGWIRDWRESVDIGGHGYLRNTWAPWAVSLRVLNWSRYLAWRTAGRVDGVPEGDPRGSTGEAGAFERAFERELYKNALFLHNHVERDVGGNHLVENGAALVAAGLLFDEHGEEWVEAGVSILESAGDRQFLDDGAHFERSPMYHVLTLTRYLTVCDLLDRDGRPIPEGVRATATEATAFLRDLRPPDGRIPLLNDAVYGEALPLDICLRYASRIPAVPEPSERQGLGATRESPARDRRRGESGYRWLRTDGGALLVDGGPVGPPHLPGHSHSDTLSILVWIDDQQLVTDSGTHGYVPGPRRQYARGVRGHSTVQVGDTEPIALGGKYLMGPRPEPTTRFEDGDVSLFEGRYRARPRDGPAYTHHRAVYAGTDWWLVRDAVPDHGGDPVRSRLPLHPDVELESAARDRIRLVAGEDGVSAAVYPLAGTRPTVATGEYFPEFGLVRERPVLELHADDAATGRSGEDRHSIGFLLTPRAVSGGEVQAGRVAGTRTSLVIGDDEYRLPERKLLGDAVPR